MRLLWAHFAWLVIALAACGATKTDHDDGSGGSAGTAQAGSGNAAGTSNTAGTAGTGTNCANVGCTAPPLCETGCTAPCGCCPCAEGDMIERAGTSYLCAGGCYAELDRQPVEWNLLQVNQGWGPCPDDNCSSQWLARPDGSIEMTKEGTPSSTLMSPANLAALEAIIAEPAFLEGMMQGFSCELPPSDVGISVTLELPEGEYVQSVTGCVLSGPAGNPAERAVNLVSQY